MPCRLRCVCWAGNESRFGSQNRTIFFGVGCCHHQEHDDIRGRDASEPRADAVRGGGVRVDSLLGGLCTSARPRVCVQVTAAAARARARARPAALAVRLRATLMHEVPRRSLRPRLARPAHESRHACSPAIVSLRAAGGFGDKSKEGSSNTPVAKVSVDEKAADPKAALEADLADLREAMGTDSKDFGKTVKGFGDTAMEKSVPEKQVMRGR